MRKPKGRSAPIHWSGESRSRKVGAFLASLFLITTHLPGAMVLAAPQVFARVGPGVSNLPLNVTAFSDPSFGEISDAVNVATGNAYFDANGVNWNNLSSTTVTSPTTSGGGGGSTNPPGGGGGTIDPPGYGGETMRSPTPAKTAKTGSTFTSSATTSSSTTSLASESKTRVTGVLRLYGFNTNPATSVPSEFSLGVGDGGQQLYRLASADEINNAPTWIKERYAGYPTKQLFISKPQVSVQTDEDWLVVATLGNNRRIAHYYDHGGNRTVFYDDGEFADFTQTPHEQYRSAKYQSDYEGIGAAAPKTEFTYTAPGNGRLRKIKDSWGRVTTYTWDEALGVVMGVNMLLKNENDDNSWMRQVSYDYDIAGTQRQVKTVIFRTEDGRGNRIGRKYSMTYRYGTNNEILLWTLTRPALSYAENNTLGITTTYTYDELNRVVRTSTPGEPDTTFDYGQSGNANQTGAGGLQVTQKQNEKITLYQFSPEGWLRNVSRRNYNPVTGIDYTPTTTSPGAGTNTMSWYDASGRIIAQSQPDGTQIQRTYDRHGNLKTEALYSPGEIWSDPPPANYKRLTRYTYDNDNQVTETIQEAMSGQGNSGGLLASDAAYSYSQVKKNYTYLKHDPASDPWNVTSANSMVGETLIVDGIPKRTFHTGIDVYGRVSNTNLYLGPKPYKTVEYAYHGEGATASLHYPSGMTVVPYDRLKSVRQYADQVYAKISNGVRTEYVYDEYGNVARELGLDRYVYNWEGATKKLAQTHHWKMYNGFGQLVWESLWGYEPDLTDPTKDRWPQVVSRQWLYYNTGELDAMWDGGIGNVTDYRYDATAGSANLGRVLAVVQGIGTSNAIGVATPHKTTEYGYDAYGRPNTETLDGFTTTTVYTTLDQPAKVTLPDGSYQMFQSHRSGLPESSLTVNVDGNSSKSLHSYDGLGREYQTQYFGNGADLGTVRTYYDAFDRPVKITNNLLTVNGTEDARSTYLKYDSSGNLTHKLDPKLTTAAGQPYIDSRRPYTGMTYDNLDREVGRCQLMTGTISDPNTMSITGNANCPWTNTEYDVFDRPVKSTDQDGYVTKLAYDNSNNVIEKEQQVWKKDGSEPYWLSVHMGFDWVITRNAWDPAARPVQQVDGRGYSKRIEYSIFGPVWFTDERGKKVKNLWYTPDGLLQGTAEPTNADTNSYVTTEYREYDARQYPARIYTSYMNSGAGPGTGARTDYTYDYAGRPLTTQLPADQSGARTAKIEQKYHNNGQPLYVIDANGFKTNFTYDYAGRLIQKHELARSSTQVDIDAGLKDGLLSSYVYDTAGNLTKKTERGLITEYKYNTLGKVISESRPRVGENTATNWKLTTYNLYGLPTAKTSYDYVGSLANDVTIPSIWEVTISSGNFSYLGYNARGLESVAVSRGSGAWEYTKLLYNNGAGVQYLRKFWGNTAIYAEQRTSTGLPTGNGNVMTFRQYDQNQNLLGKWDTPANSDINDISPLNPNDKQNVFTYTYTPTNKEETSSRDIQVRVRGAVANNVLTTNYGGTNGVVLAASVLTTKNDYNERDQLRRTDTTELTPHLDGNTPPRQDVIGNALTRHQRYSYYYDGRVENSWTGNGSIDEGYKGIELYDQRGREIQVYDSNGGRNNTTPARTYSTYDNTGTVTNRVEQAGYSLVYQHTSTPTVGGLTAVNSTTNRNTNQRGGSYTSTLSTQVSKTVYSNGTALTGVPYTTTTAPQSTGCYTNQDGVQYCDTPTPTVVTTTYDAYGQAISNTNNQDLTQNKTASFNTAGSMIGETSYSQTTYSVAGIEYTLDSRGNRLKVTGGQANNFIKRYDPDDHVTQYHKLGDSNSAYFANRDVTNRYNDFRYDPYGQQVLTSTAQINEMDEFENGKWLREHAVFRDWNSSQYVNGSVQAITRRAGSYIYNCETSWGTVVCGSGAVSENGYRLNGFQYRDATYSLADGMNDDTTWDGTKPFAVVANVAPLDAPVQSLSSILKINPLDLTAPTLPKLPDPSQIGKGDSVDQKDAPAHVTTGNDTKKALSTPAQNKQISAESAFNSNRATVPANYQDGEGFASPIYGESLIQTLEYKWDYNKSVIDNVTAAYRQARVEQRDRIASPENIAKAKIRVEKSLKDAFNLEGSDRVTLADMQASLDRIDEFFDLTYSNPKEELKFYNDLIIGIAKGTITRQDVVSFGVMATAYQHLSRDGSDWNNSLKFNDRALALGDLRSSIIYGPAFLNNFELSHRRPSLSSRGITIIDDGNSLGIVDNNIGMDVALNLLTAGSIGILKSLTRAGTRTALLSGIKFAGVPARSRALIEEAMTFGANCFRKGLNSFSASTPVQTLNGLFAISVLTIGTPVLAFNEQTGQSGYYPITAVHRNIDPNITYLIINDPENGNKSEYITTTPEHPFYVKERSGGDERPKPVGHEDLNSNWVGAGHLKIGDKIKQADGTTGVVANVTTIQQTQEMFNLTVDEAHTFYVGQNGWLVHNTWRCGDWEIGLGKVIENTTTNKGAQKIDILLSNRNDAMVWAQKQLGLDIERVYDASGKWIGWTNKAGDKVYWGHGDWGQGVGKSTFPHLNFEINGTKGHLFLQDKIANRGMLQDFRNMFNLK